MPSLVRTSGRDTEPNLRGDVPAVLQADHDWWARVQELHHQDRHLQHPVKLHTHTHRHTQVRSVHTTSRHKLTARRWGWCGWGGADWPAPSTPSPPGSAGSSCWGPWWTSSARTPSSASWSCSSPAARRTPRWAPPPTAGTSPASLPEHREEEIKTQAKTRRHSCWCSDIHERVLQWWKKVSGHFIAFVMRCAMLRTGLKSPSPVYFRARAQWWWCPAQNWMFYIQSTRTTRILCLYFVSLTINNIIFSICLWCSHKLY